MYAARVDRNQKEITKALRALGVVVEVLSRCGNGVPDLMVGWRGVIVLLELKDGEQPPSAQKLNRREREFFSRWEGFPRYKVNSVGQSVEAINDAVPEQDRIFLKGTKSGS